MKKIFVILIGIIGGMLLSSGAWGQTTVSYDFSVAGAVTGLNEASPGITLDANIGFGSFKNDGTSNPGIFSGQLRLYQNPTKGGSIKIYASNGVTITKVVVHASGTTGPAAYTVDGGAATALSASTTYTMSGLSATSVVEFYQKDGNSNNRIYVDNFEVTYTSASSGPTITLTPTSLTGFNYTEDAGPSTEQTFTVEGSDLTANISIAAPTNYEISKTSGSGYASPLTFTQSGGTVSSTVVYVRLKAGLSIGSYNNEDITATSTGATDKTVTCSGTVTVAGACATELIISEYVEGSSNNKYIEIYNGTGAIVDLTNYELRLYANGATSPTNTETLSGSLASDATLVFKNSSAAIYSGTATSSNVCNFNGDDAIALYKISTSSYVDIFGRIGEDPGTAWTSGTYTTVNKTLVRNSDVVAGITTNPTSGFPTLATEWTQYNEDEASYLGSHTMICGPTITVNPETLTGFTYIVGNGPSAEQSFTVSGTNLDANISIAASTNYEISTGTSGSFVATSPITLTQSGGNVAETTIYVRLKSGLSAGDYNSEAIIATYPPD